MSLNININEGADSDKGKRKKRWMTHDRRRGQIWLVRNINNFREKVNIKSSRKIV
jgi:hypothetical protein